MAEIKGIGTEALVSIIVSTTVGKRISESHGTAAYSNKLSRHYLKEAVFSVLNACQKKSRRRHRLQHTKSPFPELFKLTYFTVNEIVRQARPPSSRKFKGFLCKPKLQTDIVNYRGTSPYKPRNFNYTHTQVTS